ncbi:MAG: YdcF family protein [Nitrospirota bacterium]
MELTPFWFGLYKLAKYALYPLSWVALLLGLTVALALLPPSPQRHRWIRRLALSAFLALWLLSIPITADIMMGTLEAWYPQPEPAALPRFDAIVVLGGGVRTKGTLRPAHELVDLTRQRTACAADLFLQGIAPKLLLSGGDATIFGRGPTESLEMKRWAQRLGVPDNAILLEERSRTTYENAAYTKQILGDASVLLVTSASHLPRATALFRKQGLQVTPYPCGYRVQHRPADGWDELTVFDFIPDNRSLDKTTDAVVEIAGFALYRLAGKL